MNYLLVMKIKWSLDINTGAVERSEAARARRIAGATVVGPVTARADQLWHAETGPPCARTTIPNPDHYNQRAFLGMLVRGTNIHGDFGPPDQHPCRTKITVTVHPKMFSLQMLPHFSQIVQRVCTLVLFIYG